MTDTSPQSASQQPAQEPDRPAAEAASTSQQQQQQQDYECPFCVLMRKGGCEPEFKVSGRPRLGHRCAIGVL
jgi:hypothetical protein